MRFPSATLTSSLCRPHVGPRLADTVGRSSLPDLVTLICSHVAPPGSYIDPCTNLGPAIAVIRFDRYVETRRTTYELLAALGDAPEYEEAPSPPAYLARESVADGVSMI